MYITRTPETRHIGIDLKALRAFLLEQQFAPAFLDELNVIIAPTSSDTELDDEACEALCINGINAWLYAKDASLKLLKKQLLAAIRMQVYNDEQQASTEETLRNWGIERTSMTDAEIANDCLSFAVRNYEARPFVLFDTLAHYPLYETDQRSPARHAPCVPLPSAPAPPLRTPEPVKVHPTVATSIAVVTLVALRAVIARVAWGLLQEVIV